MFFSLPLGRAKWLNYLALFEVRERESSHLIFRKPFVKNHLRHFIALSSNLPFATLFSQCGHG